MKTNLKFLLCLFCLLLGFLLHSQNNQKDIDSFTPQEIWQVGLPDIQNFTNEDYNSNPNNWAFAEGTDGLMYIGNGWGVLEYDGIHWRSIKLTNNSIVRSLYKSPTGKIYVGGVGEFGFLEKNVLGKTEYRSISAELGSEYSNLGFVSSIAALNDIVFFCTKEFLFQWDGDKIKAWKSPIGFDKIFVVHGKLMVVSAEEGIMVIEDGKLKLTKQGDYFEKFDKNIAIIESYGDKYLIGIPFVGLFSYDNQSVQKVNSEDLFELSNNQIYASTLLENGDYAIATLTSGLYIFDAKEGKIVRNFRKKDGLLSDAVNAIYEARDGALWLASDRGITRIDFSSPLRKYNQSNGLSERVRNSVYDGNTLYVGTRGIYKLENLNATKPSGELSFTKIEGVDQTVRYIIPVGANKLLVERENLYDLDRNGNLTMIPGSEGVRYSHAIKSKTLSNTVYVSARNGKLYEYQFKNGVWHLGILAQLDEEIVKIAEESNGDLWLSTYYKGVYKLTKNIYGSGDSKKGLIKHFDSISGLPSSTFNFAEILNEKVYVVSENHGLYLFDSRKEIFVKDSLMMTQYDSLGTTLFSGQIYHDGYGNAWQVGLAGKHNKIYKIQGTKLSELKESNLISDFMTFNISAMDSVIMFSGPKGMVAYNQSKKRRKSKLSSVHIRRVLSKNDSLVYAGWGGLMHQEFRYELNSKVFEFSLPYFVKSRDNEYQYQLVGFDENWSSWSFDTKKYYTNIPEGDYTFKVRGKNIFGEISKEDTYSFTILAPWYRTWWAYALYGIGAFLTLILFSQWRSKQLKAKNLVLEKVVDQRTHEIKEKNLLLENQTEKLKELDTMKTRLFANISHEFRTPLTLIKGPVEKMEENGEEKLSMTNVKMIRRNANRLLKLVNQLLDLSKLDSGKLELNAAEGDIFKCLRAAASSFSSHAAQRDIDYQINIPSRALWTSFDRDKLEKITYNLLSNAFKFTPDSGKITLNVNYRNERLQVVVSDNGQGIKTDKLPHIFDRFFQVDDSYTKEKAGSGIGLALTKELVDLMQGEIYVESEFEKGSVFKVVLEVAEIKSHKKQESKEYEIIQQEVVETAIPLVQTEKKEYQVLIIEDNNDMRHFIREQLQQDFEILEAPNGKEGLKMATSKMPDLIITDLMMPQMDGITLCKKLKTQINTSHIPVVMLTAKAGIENKLEGLETGADDYLTKPFNAKELQVRVRNLVEERKKLRELFGKKTTLNPAEVTVTSMDEQFLKKVLQLLEDEHHNSEFGVPEMQTALGMSKTQLHRKLKALTDNPPGELLRNFRLKRAAQLLIQKGENVSQIAYSVGFNGLSYFTKCFKELYGVAPSDYDEKGNSNS